VRQPEPFSRYSPGRFRYGSDHGCRDGHDIAPASPFATSILLLAVVPVGMKAAGRQRRSSISTGILLREMAAMVGIEELGAGHDGKGVFEGLDAELRAERVRQPPHGP